MGDGVEYGSPAPDSPKMEMSWRGRGETDEPRGWGSGGCVARVLGRHKGVTREGGQGVKCPLKGGKK